MSQPTVSIIIPAYNVESYIGDSVAAALAQTHTAIEVIVVDDGSTDNTADCIHRFCDDRVQYHRQGNAGQSAAINRGAALASGQFIKLLDADDWIHPEHVAAQLAAIQGHPGTVASCRWGYFVDDFCATSVRQEYTHQSYLDPMQWLIDSFTKDQGMMGGWMWLIPRAVWDKAGGYDSRLSLNNDFHFSIALLLASDGVRFADDAVYSYRKGIAGALSGRGGRRAMESALLTTQLGTDLMLAHDDSDVVRRICADRFQQWLFQFYPAYPDLAKVATDRIAELGGSELRIGGGRLLAGLLPLLGWKGVRRLQHLAYRFGWQTVLQWKARRRIDGYRST